MESENLLKSATGIHITVSSANFEQGSYTDNYACPLALALNEAYPDANLIYVTPSYVSIDKVFYKLLPIDDHKLMAFAGDKDVTPLTVWLQKVDY